MGEGLLGAKAPRPSGRCLRQRSLASLESNLSRSFSSFPMGQNIEYRRVIGLRCFLRRWWWGKDYSALKRLALRAVACGNVLSLALESNLSRSFSSFPMGQNIEYRRVIGLRCFLRRWWWGRIRTSKSMTADLQSAPFGRSGTPPGVKSHCRLFSKMNGGGGRITRRYLSSPFGPLPVATFSRWRSSRTLVEGSYPSR